MRAVCPEASHDAVKAIAAFAGGMASGRTCGALAGAIGCLGILTIDSELQKDSPNSRPLIKKFLEIYTEKFEKYDCTDLRPVVAKKDTRCADFVGEVAQLVSDFAKENIK